MNTDYNDYKILILFFCAYLRKSASYLICFFRVFWLFYGKADHTQDKEQENENIERVVIVSEEIETERCEDGTDGVCGKTERAGKPVDAPEGASTIVVRPDDR